MVDQLDDAARALADKLEEITRHKSYWSVDDKALMYRVAAALRRTPPVSASREAVARIIDPYAFASLSIGDVVPSNEDFKRMKLAREKADTILFLSPQDSRCQNCGEDELTLPKRPFAFAVRRAPDNGSDQWRLFMDEAEARDAAEKLDGDYEALFRVGDRRSAIQNCGGDDTPEQVLNSIRDALEIRGYFHMANGRDIGILLDCGPGEEVRDEIEQAHSDLDSLHAPRSEGGLILSLAGRILKCAQAGDRVKVALIGLNDAIDLLWNEGRSERILNGICDWQLEARAALAALPEEETK